MNVLNPHMGVQSKLAGAYAWYVVGVMTLAYVVSSIDRIIISFLVGPIKETFTLGDFEMGLLMGPAFGIFYALFGVPIGWLADFRSRRNIIVVGIVVWCAMTALCGFAASFWLLFLARIGVGVGEATLSPCALSLISDYHERERRASAVSVYMMGTFLGSSVAFVIGAPLLSWIAGWELQLSLPFEPWRLVFIVVGLSGLIAALLVLTVREPVRHERTAALASSTTASSQSVPGILKTLQFLAAHWQGLGLVIVSMGCIFALGYTSFWMVSLFERAWGWSAGEAGIAFASIVTLCAVTGGQFGGRLSDALSRRGKLNSPALVTLLGAAIALPGYALSPLMPTGGWAIAWMIVGMFGQVAASVCAPTAVINAVPSELRGKMAALYFTIASLIGLLLGPPLVGWASDFFGGASGLQYALAAVSAAFGVLAVLFLIIAQRPYRDGVERLEKQLVASE